MTNDTTINIYVEKSDNLLYDKEITIDMTGDRLTKTYTLLFSNSSWDSMREFLTDIEDGAGMKMFNFIEEWIMVEIKILQQKEFFTPKKFEYFYDVYTIKNGRAKLHFSINDSDEDTTNSEVTLQELTKFLDRLGMKYSIEKRKD